VAGEYRKDLHPGLAVAVVLKSDQRSGRLTLGIVRDILTSAPFHSRGIKVRLADGQIGRVKIIGESGAGAMLQSTRSKEETDE
jgi:uncharacterized repeat protein (TIGR03833 family)